jgi:hypothetical protein
MARHQEEIYRSETMPDHDRGPNLVFAPLVRPMQLSADTWMVLPKRSLWVSEKVV